MVGAWEALLRVHAALVPVLARRVEDATGLPLSWYDVLFELDSVPQRRLRMQDLGARVVLSRSRVSRIVDEMVRAGLVEKIPDPADGRATLAVMTSDGRRAFRRTAPVYVEAIQQTFGAGLDSDQLRAIKSGLGKVLASLGPSRAGEEET